MHYHSETLLNKDTSSQRYKLKHFLELKLRDKTAGKIAVLEMTGLGRVQLCGTLTVYVTTRYSDVVEMLHGTYSWWSEHLLSV